MMLLALLLRPWAIAVDTMGAIPRVLADDLMILTSGINHLSKMQEAVNYTPNLAGYGSHHRAAEVVLIF